MSPAISVFTPSHDAKYLNDCYISLISQTFDDWEWVILLNGNAMSSSWLPPKFDSRVRIYRSQSTGIGRLKKEAVAHCTGDILVELDHDDMLSSDALEAIDLVFHWEDSIGFVYSATAQVNEDGTKNEDRFNQAMGWRYEEVTIDEKRVLSCVPFDPYPSAVSYIWFAPNHFRAFRRSVYDEVGGYDETLDVLDDQDLMCRLYKVTKFHAIHTCRYFQRVHGGNTQSQVDTNALIQARTVELYDKYVQDCALAWAKREDLICLDLGSAHNKPDGYVGLDIYDGPGVDIVADVTMGIPCEDNSVGVIRAVDFLEHIPDKIELFNEMYRVLAHGGMLLSLTPSTDGRGAFQDPTHVAYYNENAFWYFTNSEYSKFVPEIECKFQVSCLKTIFPSQWHRDNNISYVQANLVAIKDGPRLPGLLNY